MLIVNFLKLFTEIRFVLEKLNVINKWNCMSGKIDYLVPYPNPWSSKNP